MINYKVFFYTVTFGISFSIIFCDWFFVTFSLGTAAQKKFTRKRVFKGNFVQKRERNMKKREVREFVLVPASNTRKGCFKIMKNILQLRVCDFTVTQDCMQQIISHPEQYFKLSFLIVGSRFQFLVHIELKWGNFLFRQKVREREKMGIGKKSISFWHRICFLQIFGFFSILI